MVTTPPVIVLSPTLELKARKADTKNHKTHGCKAADR
jgi:hypothetical protein